MNSTVTTRLCTLPSVGLQSDSSPLEHSPTEEHSDTSRRCLNGLICNLSEFNSKIIKSLLCVSLKKNTNRFKKMKKTSPDYDYFHFLFNLHI